MLKVNPSTSAGIATYPPGATFGPRNLRDFEFVWMIEGDALYMRDDATFDAPAGSIVLCTPSTVDAFRWDLHRRTRHAFFHFNLPRQRMTGWPAMSRWPVVRNPSEGDILRPIFRHILATSHARDPLLTRLSINHLLRAFVTGQVELANLPSSSFPEPVERTLDYIREAISQDPATPLALADLASAASVTEEHLCRLFKRHLALGPMETVRLARLDQSAILLARSNYSIERVAEICGFASQFHFSRRFRAAFKASPSEIRKRIIAGETPPLSRLVRVMDNRT